jgi:acyl-CoA synthetase (AMP-forming)/AMP-acid ligase II
MDAHGSLLAPGEFGEVALRGDQIMSGYLSPPGANEAAFRGDWFRTGDQGVLDSSGELTLVGRLKEMINCGGEKISPYEVERALLQNPGVAQAVVFAVPHRLLGEAVAAAVVVRKGCKLSESDLLESCGEGLARYKRPRQLVFVDDIPRGATGKLQRIGLAARLGLS